MEAVWKIEVEDFPAFIVVDDKGNCSGAFSPLTSDTWPRRRASGRHLHSCPAGTHFPYRCPWSTSRSRDPSPIGELVCGERRDENAPTAIELRRQRAVRHGHPRGEHRSGAGERSASGLSRRRELSVGGLGLWFTMHGCSPTTGSRSARSSRSSRPWSTGCAIWHGAPRSGPARRRAGHGRGRRHRGRTRGGAAGVVRPDPPRCRQRPGQPGCTTPTRCSTRSSSSRPPAGCSGPAASSRSGRRTRRNELEDTMATVFGNAEVIGHDVLLQDRDERFWLYVARVTSET